MPDEFSPGDRLGSFRVIALLGRGGMGAVYLAEDKSLDRRVALKVIRSNLADDSTFRRRFENEARSAAAIDHPNVVPIYSAGHLDGHLHIAMRYVEGPDLEARLRGEPGEALSVDNSLHILAAVAAALDEAHERGLVHRDVKPANILLEDRGGPERVFLTDFGLTRPLGAGRGETETGSWLGTPDYAAPEQMESGWVDARTDVYALGCVLYRMLSGEVPHKGTGPQKVLSIVGGEIPTIPDVDPAINAVIQRATAKRPGDRYPSAGDLSSAARSAAAGEGLPTVEQSVATGAAATGRSEAQSEAPTETFGPTEVTRSMEADGGAGWSRKKLLAAVSAGAAIVAGIGAAIVIASGSGGEQTTIVRTTASTVTEEVPSEEPAESTQELQEPETTDAEPPESIEASLYEGAAYSIVVPSVWDHEVQDERSSEGFYTNKWFDPSEPATFIRSDGGNPYSSGDLVEGTRGFVERNEAAGYETIFYGADVVGGRPAARWVFLDEGDKRSDYFFTECGEGLAVVGSAPAVRFPVVEQLFREVAASARLYCGDY